MDIVLGNIVLKRFHSYYRVFLHLPALHQVGEYGGYYNFNTMIAVT